MNVANGAGAFPDEVPSIKIHREDCTYTGCYCEENVYKLIEQLGRRNPTNDLSNLYAVFISNDKKQVGYS